MTIPKLRYSSLLLFFIVFITTTFQWFFKIFPYEQAKKYLQDTDFTYVEQILNNYPDGLIFSVANGEILANQASPICLKFDKMSKVGILYDQDATAEDFLSLSQTKNNKYANICNPIAMATRTSVVWQDSDGYKISPISKEIKIDITKNFLQNFAKQALTTILPIVTFLYFSGPLIVVLFILLGYFFINYWYSWVSRFTIKKITKQELTKREAYRLSFFIFAILIILNKLVVDLLIHKLLNNSTFSLNIPFFNTIIITIVTTVLVKSGKIVTSLPPSPPPPSPPPPLTPSGLIS